jgi:hypothetical protein
MALLGYKSTPHKITPVILCFSLDFQSSTSHYSMALLGYKSTPHKITPVILCFSLDFQSSTSHYSMALLGYKSTPHKITPVILCFSLDFQSSNVALLYGVAWVQVYPTQDHASNLSYFFEIPVNTHRSKDLLGYKLTYKSNPSSQKAIS